VSACIYLGRGPPIIHHLDTKIPTRGLGLYVYRPHTYLSLRGRTFQRQGSHGTGISRDRVLTGLDSHETGLSRDRVLTGLDSHGTGLSRDRVLMGQGSHGIGFSRDRVLTGQGSHRTGTGAQFLCVRTGFISDKTFSWDRDRFRWKMDL
jgi:hypothetical protein